MYVALILTHIKKYTIHFWLRPTKIRGVIYVEIIGIKSDGVSWFSLDCSGLWIRVWSALWIRRTAKDTKSERLQHKEEQNRIDTFLRAGYRTPGLKDLSANEAISGYGSASTPLSIREWLPKEETIEGCKARLERIVSKQKKCYFVYLIRMCTNPKQEKTQDGFQSGSIMSSYIETFLR